MSSYEQTGQQRQRQTSDWIPTLVSLDFTFMQGVAFFAAWKWTPTIFKRHHRFAAWCLPLVAPLDARCVHSLRRHKPFLWGHWCPCCGHLPWVSNPEWMPSLACFVECAQQNPHILLWCDTCWPPRLQYIFKCIHVPPSNSCSPLQPLCFFNMALTFHYLLTKLWKGHVFNLFVILFT